MGDRATLGEAFDVQVDVDLNIGSNAYTSSGSDNYGFRIYLSKILDRITPDSEDGKDYGAYKFFSDVITDSKCNENSQFHNTYVFQ